MKKFRLLILVLITILVVTLYFQYPKLTIISGYTSKYMVSQVFVAGRKATSVNETDFQVPLIKFATAEIDRTNRTANAEVYGLKNRKAVFREGLGGVLLNEDYPLNEDYLKPERNIKFDSLPYPLGHLPAKDTLFDEVDYNKLEAAIDLAFADPETQRTRTVLVLYKDHLIAERYVEGFGPETPVLGWSMTKSVLATLYGILEYQNRIKLDSPAPIDSWQEDSRKNITINNLLRMQSSLAWNEDYGSFSDVNRMLFMTGDMTKAQENKEHLGAPGDIWNYSSGTSNLLSGILRKELSNYQDYLNLPYKELADRIGMHSLLIETDLAGNFVGSSYAWASTRDWARFGLLYLRNGNWNGEQLFDKSWVDYITKPTEHSNGTYGAHFWLNAEGKYADVPTDLYSANGYQGQHVFIIPSKDLVIVRTGLAETPEFDLDTFLAQIVAAFP
ncbi:MAG: serine hydrolase [Eudoraea sp.]|nr:serine hydrolase [Eudoraea sp.]